MDITGDGVIDIISGAYSPGRIHIFAGRREGEYAAGSLLVNILGKPLDVGRRSVPFACDWDGDGDLDLLVGESGGRVLLFTRLEDKGVGGFGAGHRLTIGAAGEKGAKAEELKVSAYAAPTVADWDQDGLPDLLVGDNKGGITLFRNTGAKGRPCLAPGTTLLAPPASNRLQEGQRPSRPGGRLFVTVADWNEDGRPDLILGDCAWMEGRLPDPPPVTPQQAKAARLEYMRLFTLYRKLAKAPAGETREEKKRRLARMEELRKDYQRQRTIYRSGTPRITPHGYVWVLLRRPAP